MHRVSFVPLTQDEAKLPEFRLPLFNDLEITKKFSIVQIGSAADGTHERTISLVDDLVRGL